MMKSKKSKRQKTSSHRPDFWGNEFPIAIAHRGGDAAGIEKENSLAAFKSAYEMGFRWMETDVVPTKDGVLLAIHGRGYQRKPNKDLPHRLKIQRKSYAQIKRMRVGGESILTLEKLLDTFPHVKFFIDPKTVRAADVLGGFLAQRPKDIHRICVGSFIPGNTKKVRRLIGEVTGQNVTTAIIGPLMSIPVRLGSRFGFIRPLASWYIVKKGATELRVPYRWILGNVGERLVKTAHRLGLLLIVYTPNEREDIELCVQKGVDGVMSDNLQLSKEIIGL